MYLQVKRKPFCKLAFHGPEGEGRYTWGVGGLLKKVKAKVACWPSGPS